MTFEEAKKTVEKMTTTEKNHLQTMVLTTGEDVPAKDLWECIVIETTPEGGELNGPLMGLIIPAEGMPERVEPGELFSFNVNGKDLTVKIIEAEYRKYLFSTDAPELRPGQIVIMIDGSQNCLALNFQTFPEGLKGIKVGPNARLSVTINGIDFSGEIISADLPDD